MKTEKICHGRLDFACCFVNPSCFNQKHTVVCQSYYAPLDVISVVMSSNNMPEPARVPRPSSERV